MFSLPSIAIDIGSSAIKVFERRTRGSYLLTNIGSIEISKGLVENGRITNINEVKRNLKSLLRSIGVRAFRNRTIISLSSSAAIIRRIKVPKNSVSDIGETIYYEAEQYFDHDINDLYYDYFIEESEKGDLDVPVILVGARKEVVDTAIDIVKSSGLSIGAVDIDILAITNIFNHIFPEHKSLDCVVNIGASSSQIIIIGDGKFLYTRNIPISGNSYTEAIANSLSLDEEKAESLKIRGAKKDVEKIRPTIENHSRQLASDIASTVDYFFKTEEIPAHLDSLNKIYLLGGSCSLPGLDLNLKEELSLEVEYLNPMSGIKISPEISKKGISNYYQYSVVCGMFLRDIDVHEN